MIQAEYETELLLGYYSHEVMDNFKVIDPIQWLYINWDPAEANGKRFVCLPSISHIAVSL